MSALPSRSITAPPRASSWPVSSARWNVLEGTLGPAGKVKLGSGAFLSPGRSLKAGGDALSLSCALRRLPSATAKATTRCFQARSLACISRLGHPGPGQGGRQHRLAGYANNLRRHRQRSAIMSRLGCQARCSAAERAQSTGGTSGVSVLAADYARAHARQEHHRHRAISIDGERRNRRLPHRCARPRHKDGGQRLDIERRSSSVAGSSFHAIGTKTSRAAAASAVFDRGRCTRRRVLMCFAERARNPSSDGMRLRPQPFCLAEWREGRMAQTKIAAPEAGREDEAGGDAEP